MWVWKWAFVGKISNAMSHCALAQNSFASRMAADTICHARARAGPRGVPGGAAGAAAGPPDTARAANSW